MVIIILISILYGSFYYYQKNQISILKQTLENLQNNKQNKFSDVLIEKLGDKYYINIQKGNESFCIWRYSAGNGNIPYIEMTKAKTLNEKHHLLLGEAFWNFSVYCFDDWGNNYIGILNKN
jgi:hypothetical protein